MSILSGKGPAPGPLPEYPPHVQPDGEYPRVPAQGLVGGSETIQTWLLSKPQTPAEASARARSGRKHSTTRRLNESEGTRGLQLFITTVLLLGALAGLAFNRAASGMGARFRTHSPMLATSEVLPGTELTLLDLLAAEGSKTAQAAGAGPAIRAVDISLPEDPFQAVPELAPVEAPVEPGDEELGEFEGVPVLPPVEPCPEGAPPARAQVTAAPPKPVEPCPEGALPSVPAAPAVPDPDQFTLAGLIQGDPPLAVIRYEDQTLFLKIGDQVADTWRLVEVKERSAIFQLGEQRVEVPIQGGSSQ
jgi:hypothetical protein